MSGVPAGSLAALRRETERLRAEEEAAHEQAAELATRIAESMARAKRLKTQRLSVEARSKKLLHRVIDKLDEADEVAPATEKGSSDEVVASPSAVAFAESLALLSSKNPF